VSPLYVYRHIHVLKSRGTSFSPTFPFPSTPSITSLLSFTSVHILLSLPHFSCGPLLSDSPATESNIHFVSHLRGSSRGFHGPTTAASQSEPDRLERPCIFNTILRLRNADVSEGTALTTAAFRGDKNFRRTAENRAA